jgi:polyisoprenoid-binding protein YceI
MKKFTLILTALTAFQSGLMAQSKTQTVDAANSSIHWLGKKVTGQHEGFIQLKSGALEMENGQLTGGAFVVDMATLYSTDLQGESKANLEGHLKSDDFFGVAQHPEATFKIKNATKKSEGVYAINGEFTIKGITNPASFDMTVGENSATAKVVIDRSKFNIRYGSSSFFDNLGDKVIYDDFELDVTLKL